jgi:hypothetical protein
MSDVTTLWFLGAERGASFAKTAQNYEHMGYSQVNPSVILISWEYQEKGGNSNEWSYLWCWRSLDVDWCNFGIVHSARNRFPCIYLLIGPNETAPSALAC